MIIELNRSLLNLVRRHGARFCEDRCECRKTSSPNGCKCMKYIRSKSYPQYETSQNTKSNKITNMWASLNDRYWISADALHACFSDPRPIKRTYGRILLNRKLCDPKKTSCFFPFNSICALFLCLPPFSPSSLPALILPYIQQKALCAEHETTSSISMLYISDRIAASSRK